MLCCNAQALLNTLVSHGFLNPIPLTPAAKMKEKRIFCRNSHMRIYKSRLVVLIRDLALNWKVIHYKGWGGGPYGRLRQLSLSRNPSLQNISLLFHCLFHLLSFQFCKFKPIFVKFQSQIVGSVEKPAASWKGQMRFRDFRM